MNRQTRTGSKRRSRPASPATPSGGSAERPAPPFLLLALLLAALAVTFALYTRSFDHEFLSWDDQEYVTENPLVRNREYGTLLRAIVSSNYHPLTMLSLGANVAAPLSPRPFLVTNALLHTFNTGLVFWLALLLAGRRLFPALWTALFFGIHPMHVESVAWIAERKDVLYTAFFVGGLIAYWRYLERRGRDGSASRSCFSCSRAWRKGWRSCSRSRWC